MKGFLLLNFGGFGTLALDWWCWELITFMAGMLGEKEFAVYAILSTLVQFAFMIPMGTGFALSTRIGYLLGEQRYYLAKKIAKIYWMLSILLGLCIGIIIFIFRHTFSHLITSNKEIVHKTGHLIYLASIAVTIDEYQTIAQSIIRGVAMQSKGLIAVLLGNWLIGIPSTYFFGFYMDYGIEGLYLGMLIRL